MKNKITKISLLVFLNFVFIINNVALANNQEIIHSFKSDILVKQNAEVEIQETIIYNFGSNQKHGIFRSIPYKHPLENKILVLDYKVKEVVDENNQQIKYSISKNRNNFIVKIGDKDKLISGQKTYIIKYSLKGIINYFDSHDELFFNINGNEWEVPIENIEANFNLDNFFANTSLKDDFNAICYTETIGSREQNCQIDKSYSTKIISFSASNLKPKQGLTIAVSWPKGLVEKIDKTYNTISKGLIKSYNEDGKITLLGKFLFTLQYLLLSFPLLVLIKLIIDWQKKGKNPRALRTIIAEYEAPININPAEAHIIMTEAKIDLGKMATATLIDLARRGYFIIKEQEKKVLFSKKIDWSLIKINKQKPEDQLNDYEQYLLKNIFKDKEEISLSQLKNISSVMELNKIKKELNQAKIALGDKIFQKDLMPNNPFKLIREYQILGVKILISFVLANVIVCILLGEKIGIIGAIFGTVAICIIFSIFSNIMPSLTDKGMEIKEKLKGFKLFLKTVEKDRVKFHFSPEAHPKKFAEYLPYAILFGVEKQWAVLFKDIKTAIPDWYQGKQGDNFNSVIFISNINQMNSGIKESFVMTGSAAASGESGFSGGGSGGGFGGGGGGSW